MPGHNRAELSTELSVVPSWGEAGIAARSVRGRAPSSEPVWLAHESGPGSTMLAGGRHKVRYAMREVIEASLGAGAPSCGSKSKPRATPRGFTPPNRTGRRTPY
jgi:hypothetical protein